jgi:hypothetical protein
MYMTSGNRSFEKKTGHNYSQMHRWIRHWKQGEVLSGNSGDRQHQYAYGDIDHIIGFSVVGGRDSVCKFDPDQILYGHKKDVRSKSSICATITDEVFHKLAQRSVGLRDIIHFVGFLMYIKAAVESEEAIKYLDAWAWKHAEESRKEFNGLWQSREDLEEAWMQTKLTLRAMKDHEQHSDTKMMSEMCMADAIWMSVAERSLARIIAPPGQFGQLCVGKKRTAPHHIMSCFVVANVKIMAETADKTVSGDPGIHLVSCIQFGSDNPFRLVAINDISHSYIAKACADIKDSVIQGVSLL